MKTHGWWLLLALSACTDPAIQQARVDRIYQAGYRCVQAGETYRGCDHMCYNFVHHKDDFAVCIRGAREALFARIPQ